MRWSIAIREYLMALIALMLPLWQKAIPILLVLFLVVTLLGGGYGKNMAKNRSAVWMAALCSLMHLLLLLGLLWTENMDAGWKDVGSKLSFAFLPWMFVLGSDLSERSFSRVLRTFVIGCVAACIYCLGAASIRYFMERAWFYQFYAKNLSILMHLGYFAMHLNIALIICYNMLSRKQVVGRVKWLVYAGIGVMVLTLFLTASKNGIAFFGIMFTVLLVREVVRNKRFVAAVIGLVIMAGAFFGVKYGLPFTYGRFEKAITVMWPGNADATSGSSTGIRMAAWQSGTELLAENPIGVGTGDVTDELMKKYELYGFDEAYVKRVNAHSQFVQNAVALGWAGLLVLAVLFIYIVIRSFRYSELVWLSMLSLLIAAFTESIFEKQAGIVLFTFMVPLLLTGGKYTKQE